MADAISSQTVVALFDDQIDAEHALSALKKATRPAASVSVLARDRAKKLTNDSPIDVTRAVMDTALSTMSGWLIGLAALMVPESGTFLAAGPIGVMLAKHSPETIREALPETMQSETEPELVGNVGLVFELFGFPPEEAHYLEERLAAGSALIAVTSDVQEQIETTLRTFADFDAVFIGQAETSEGVIDETERWLANPMGTDSSEVIIADVVVTMRSAKAEAGDLADAFGWCGLDVFDIDESKIGEVEDVLVDAVDSTLLRYLIVAHGGVLGIARKRTPVPAIAVTRTDDGVTLIGGHPRLAEAPAFDPATPFSRKDELAIYLYFGLTPYWNET